MTTRKPTRRKPRTWRKKAGSISAYALAILRKNIHVAPQVRA